MINAYRRTARTYAELNLGELVPMVEAIPELAEALLAHWDHVEGPIARY